MAKLYGKADSTLVAAAFKHGASNVPMDLSSVYKDRVANVKNFATEIGKAFDKIYADDKATNDLLTDVSTKALDLMETGVYNEHDQALNMDIVTGFKSRYKSITDQYGKLGKEGDIERSKLRSEMNRYIANIQKDSELYNNLVQLSSNSVLLGDVGDPRKELLAKIIEDQNNNTNFVKKEYDKGQIYYSIPSKSGETIRMTMPEINEGLAAEDPKTISNIQLSLTKVQSRGQQKGGKITTNDIEREINNIKGQLTTKSSILNASQFKFGGMDYSFDEVLTGRAKKNGVIDTELLNTIYDELEKLGGADLNSDGEIDETDKGLLQKARSEGKIYVDAKNGITLIDAIKKDKKLHRDLLANYLGQTAVKDFYGYGSELYKAPKTGTDEKTASYSLNTTLRGGLSTNTLQSYVNQLESGTVVNPRDGKKYNVNNDKSWTTEDGTKTISGDNMINEFQIHEYENRGWNFEDPENITQGKATYVFTQDVQFAPFRGSSVKEVQGESDIGLLSETSTGEINNAFNMTNNVVENGLAAGIFMQDDDDAAETLKALLPPGFIIKKAGAVSKFFGVDKLTITSPDGTNLGTFDFGYRDSEKALEESKRFNSNVVEGDYFRRNNIVLGNL